MESPRESELQRDFYGALTPESYLRISEEYKQALLHYLPALQAIAAAYQQAIIDSNFDQLWSFPPDEESSTDMSREKKFVELLCARVEMAVNMLRTHAEQIADLDHEYHREFFDILFRIENAITKRCPDLNFLHSLTKNSSPLTEAWDTLARRLSDCGISIHSSAHIQTFRDQCTQERANLVHGMDRCVERCSRANATNTLGVDDLKQEIFLRLHMASGTYDPAHEAKFSTYVWREVNRTIWSAQSRQRPFKISYRVQRQLHRMEKLLTSKDVPIRRNAQINFLSRKLKVNASRIKELLPWCFRNTNVLQSLDQPIPEQEYSCSARSDDDEESLDQQGEWTTPSARFDDDEESLDQQGEWTTLADTIPDNHPSADPTNHVDFVTLQNRIAQALKTLSYRHRAVLTLRYGLFGGNVHTLKEVGKFCGVGAARIGVNEASAINKLRQAYWELELAPFAEMDFAPYPGDKFLSDESMKSDILPKETL